MNIFALHINPKRCVYYYADKHIVKMVLETAQLLCNAHDASIAPYKHTHLNHPCSKWTTLTTGNYDWVCELGLALCEEYTRRYGRRHKSQEVIEWCTERMPVNIPYGPRTEFLMVMPDEFKIPHSPITSYRQYYIHKIKSLGLKFTRRHSPRSIIGLKK